MSKRVVLAGLFHETHTFLRSATGLDDFVSMTADEILASAGQPSQAAGVVEVAEACGWTLIPGPHLMARPSGTVEDAVVETFWEHLLPLLEGADAILLELHGAMAARSFPDVEGEIVARIRSVTGIPIGGLLDLHGNMTDRMCVQNAVFTGYRHNPHIDTKATAIRAAHLLDRLLTTGVRPVVVREQPPLVWSPLGTATVSDPMYALITEAARLVAADPEIWDISVFGGFSFADISECGPSFLATTVGDPEAARAHLRRLCEMAVSMKEMGCPPRASLSRELDRLKAHSPTPGTGPFLIVEPSDNIGGGAPGDTTHILRGLVERGIPNSAVMITDAEAVEALWEAPAGEAVTLPIGGKSGEIGCEPVTLTVRKVSRSDGEFTLEDRQSHSAVHGLVQHMGRCVVARTDGGVTILLNSQKAAPTDLGQWRSQGIDPERLSVIGVKAAVSHRRAYDPIASGQVVVDTPGPCDENLPRLPFRNIRRPVWPLD